MPLDSMLSLHSLSLLIRLSWVALSKPSHQYTTTPIHRKISHYYTTERIWCIKPEKDAKLSESEFIASFVLWSRSSALCKHISYSSITQHIQATKIHYTIEYNTIEYNTIQYNTRTHACTHACTHAPTHACTHAHTHTHTRMHARTHTHTIVLRPYWILPGTTWVSWHQKGKIRKVKPIWIYWSKRKR